MTPTAVPRVLIADDHPLVAQGLKVLLAPDYDVVALVEDAREVEDAITVHQPDVLLLDLSMPHRNGTEVLQSVRRRFPTLRVLVVTMHVDKAFAELSFQGGADGFIPKEASAVELRAAIAAVQRGERYLSPRVERHRYRAAEVADPLADRLSVRQRQILRLIGLGKSNAEIAATLGVSPRTIEFHRTGIKRALGLTSETALQRYAIVTRLAEEAATPT
jgi:DNA-binding NarL/FixJ family response regulator